MDKFNLFIFKLACEKSRLSLLPARVAFHEKDVCYSTHKIPNWWRESVPHLVMIMSADWFEQQLCIIKSVNNRDIENFHENNADILAKYSWHLYICRSLFGQSTVSFLHLYEEHFDFMLSYKEAFCSLQEFSKDWKNVKNCLLHKTFKTGLLFNIGIEKISIFSLEKRRLKVFFSSVYTSQFIFFCSDYQ